RVAKDLYAAEANRGGDAVAIGVQVLGGLVPDPIEVHLDPVDDRQQRVARNRERAHRLRQRAGDRVRGNAVARVAQGDVAPPAGELPALLRDVRTPPTREVGDVVHGAAEGVDGVQRIPPGLG